MGQKKSPILLRLGLNQTWKTESYDSKSTTSNYSQKLHTDFLLRDWIKIVYPKIGAGTYENQIATWPGSATQLSLWSLKRLPGGKCENVFSHPEENFRELLFKGQKKDARFKSFSPKNPEKKDIVQHLFLEPILETVPSQRRFQAGIEKEIKLLLQKLQSLESRGNQAELMYTWKKTSHSSQMGLEAWKDFGLRFRLKSARLEENLIQFKKNAFQKYPLKTRLEKVLSRPGRGRHGFFHKVTQTKARSRKYMKYMFQQRFGQDPIVWRTIGHQGTFWESCFKGDFYEKNLGPKDKKSVLACQVPHSILKTAAQALTIPHWGLKQAYKIVPFSTIQGKGGKPCLIQNSKMFQFLRKRINRKSYVIGLKSCLWSGRAVLRTNSKSHLNKILMKEKKNNSMNPRKKPGKKLVSNRRLSSDSTSEPKRAWIPHQNLGDSWSWRNARYRSKSKIKSKSCKLGKLFPKRNPIWKGANANPYCMEPKKTLEILRQVSHRIQTNQTTKVKNMQEYIAKGRTGCAALYAHSTSRPSPRHAGISQESMVNFTYGNLLKNMLSLSKQYLRHQQQENKMCQIQMYTRYSFKAISLRRAPSNKPLRLIGFLDTRYRQLWTQWRQTLSRQELNQKQMYRANQVIKKGIRNKTLKQDKWKEIHSLSDSILECLKKERDKEISVQEQSKQDFEWKTKNIRKRTVKPRENQSSVNVKIKDVRMKEKPFLGSFSGENSKMEDSSMQNEIELHVTNERKKKTEKWHKILTASAGKRKKQWQKLLTKGKNGHGILHTMTLRNQKRSKKKVKYKNKYYQKKLRYALVSFTSLLGKNQNQVIIKQSVSNAGNAHVLLNNLSRFLISWLKYSQGGPRNKFKKLKIKAEHSLKRIARRNTKRYKGIALQFSGRVYGAKKAKSFKTSIGRVPTSTLKAKIGYSQVTQQTGNGAWGFKLWTNSIK